MSELRELYQELIIDHGRHPRNYGAMQEANSHKEGYNPLCGDKITLHVYHYNGVIEKLKFEGAGCAISMASASLMTESLQGKTIKEFEGMFSMFHALVTQGHLSEELKIKLGKLAVLGGVAEFPARVKCATLAWHTMNSILHHVQGIVCTEEQ